jgi:hypothetical protein
MFCALLFQTAIILNLMWIITTLLWFYFALRKCLTLANAFLFRCVQESIDTEACCTALLPLTPSLLITNSLTQNLQQWRGERCLIL